jgi:hypothetical protein
MQTGPIDMQHAELGNAELLSRLPVIHATEQPPAPVQKILPARAWLVAPGGTLVLGTSGTFALVMNATRASKRGDREK